MSTKYSAASLIPWAAFRPDGGEEANAEGTEVPDKPPDMIRRVGPVFLLLQSGLQWVASLPFVAFAKPCTRPARIGLDPVDLLAIFFAANTFYDR